LSDLLISFELKAKILLRELPIEFITFEVKKSTQYINKHLPSISTSTCLRH